MANRAARALMEGLDGLDGYFSKYLPQLLLAVTVPLIIGVAILSSDLLSAVILAVGMVVDASVVVLENIVRLRDEGADPVDAARDGTDQVQLPVLAGAATTLVVLIPLLGLPGFVGKVFGPLASTLIIAFSASVLVALVLVPILSLQLEEGGRLELLAQRLAAPFQRMMDGLQGAYLALLELLERRLDNVVFRAGYAATIPAARQMVNHGHIEVNGQRVDVPSYQCRPGDVVALREKSKHRERVAAEIARAALQRCGALGDRPVRARLEALDA